MADPVEGQGAEGEFFARLIDALRPWLDLLTIVGGWAHRLYRLHPLAQPPTYAPLLTHDADLAIPALGTMGRGNIGEQLRAAGFAESLSGGLRPPVTQYRLPTESGSPYVEFLMPLRGGLRRRDGTLNATTEFAGITAQNLRHLDLLLVEPWTVKIDRVDGFPVSAPATLRVPNVASYLIHKLLIHSKRRTSEQRAKDVLYIHDTIELFGGALDEIREAWSLHVNPELGRRERRRIVESAAALFSSVSDEARVAAREATAASGRILSPESIVRVCRRGLGVVLGGDT